LTDIFSPQQIRFIDHGAGDGETPFPADVFPEVDVKRAFIIPSLAQARHDHAFCFFLHDRIVSRS
jgi:hypothetical protein